jgi:hypothetical protein
VDIPDVFFQQLTTEDLRTEVTLDPFVVTRFWAPYRAESAAAEVWLQRVYDTTAGWCYYEGPRTDSPDPTATQPNHTGNITLHQILGRAEP